MDERFHLCLIDGWLVGHDVSPFFLAREPTGDFTGRLTPAVSRTNSGSAADAVGVGSSALFGAVSVSGIRGHPV
jgi:hypothetical protein